MRIECPDCDAQYEVPDDVIPAEGRDVQCSNCGTTWFFEHPDASRGDTDTRDADVETDEEEEGTPPLAPAPRRELDPQIADILRTEAQREAKARSQEVMPEPLEVQTELGLTEGRAKSPQRAAGSGYKDVGDTAVTETAGPTTPGNMTVASAMAEGGSRRNRLPDIEEINSTLRSGDESHEAAGRPARTEHAAPKRKRGFRGGLVFALLLFAAGLAAYQFAPEIAEAVPQADPWLSSYVTWVEEMRVTLDTNLRLLLEWLDSQATALTAQ